jgi:E3 ubiquitin-protein ligase BRE1
VIDDGKKTFAEVSTELRRTQESLSLANLAIERHRKAGETKAIPSSQKEAQLQKEVDKCMVRTKAVRWARPDLCRLQSILKCSTCRQNMRSTILTKCLHSAFSYSVLYSIRD